MIFTIDHVPWNLKPIPVPRAHIPKIIDLLMEKVAMGILEPSNASFSNRWFCYVGVVKPRMAPPPPQGGLLVREREKKIVKQRNDTK